jgi:hypothetical protein
LNCPTINCKRDSQSRKSLIFRWYGLLTDNNPSIENGTVILNDHFVPAAIEKSCWDITIKIAETPLQTEFQGFWLKIAEMLTAIKLQGFPRLITQKL